MNNRILLSGLCAVALITSPANAAHFGKKNDKGTSAAQSTATQSRPASFADLAEDLIPTVVNISSTVASPSPDKEFENIMPNFPEGSPFGDFFERFMERPGPGGISRLPSASLGSGFIIDADKGYIVTNNHVIANADEIRITLPNDESVEADIIGTDKKTDLADLQIDTKHHDLKAATLGDSDAIRVGDWVLAIGNPFGLGGTVTSGIISARARDINSGPYDDYLQTDASINRGNSGGPMFNLDGEVIGINTAIFSPTGGSVGIGFAIPSALAGPIIDQLIEFGQTRRGWLGVKIQTVTDEIAESLGLDTARGALVASVTTGGPAEAAGIKAGDIILNFNDQAIEEMRALPRIVAETLIDTETTVTVLREGEEIKLSVTIGELEKAEEEGLLDQHTGYNAGSRGTEFTGLGITVDPIAPVLVEEFGLDESLESGLVITDIEPGTDAAKKGLLPGDVILEVNQAIISGANDLEDAIRAANDKGRGSVLLLIHRGQDVRFVALKIEDPEGSE